MKKPFHAVKKPGSSSDWLVTAPDNAEIRIHDIVAALKGGKPYVQFFMDAASAGAPKTESDTLVLTISAYCVSLSIGLVVPRGRTLLVRTTQGPTEVTLFGYLEDSSVTAQP